MFQNPNYSKKYLENHLINNFVASHDLVCICKKPTYHILDILSRKIGPELSTPEKQQIKQCLGDAPTTADTTVDPDVGDLDALFAEEDTQDDTG